MSDELIFLQMLHSLGATESGKTIAFPQLSEWTGMDNTTLQLYLQKLIELGYLQRTQAEGIDKYHLTLDGIRKCARLKRKHINALHQLAELKDQLVSGAITQEEYDLKEKELRKKSWDPT